MDAGNTVFLPNRYCYKPIFVDFLMYENIVMMCIVFSPRGCSSNCGGRKQDRFADGL